MPTNRHRRERRLVEAEPDDRLPAYPRSQLIAMDGAFTTALLKAAATGLEHPPATAISTAAGTRRPVFVG